LSSAREPADFRRLLEAKVEFLRARRIKDEALIIRDPQPVESVADAWASAADAATIGIFLITLVAGLYFCRPILLPILAAFVIGTTLAPIVRGAARHGISPWVSAGALAAVLVVGAATALTLLAQPLSEWIAKAPAIGETIKHKLYVLERPLAAARELQEALLPSAGPAVAVEPSQLGIVTPVLAFVTPTVIEFMLFFVTLIFFLAVQIDFRRYLVSLFSSRDAKLRFLRIARDVETNLASYLATVTVINLALGTVVALGAWLFGFPSPIILGILAMVLNYVPYIGAGCLTFILFAVGLVTFPSLSYALLPPAAFVALATLEGQIITPAILGHRLTLNPLAVLLALAFWAWIWGPIGAFLAVPLTIVILVTIGHLVPSDEDKLPG
jgi:predicted PurR-regulated permease PerM